MFGSECLYSSKYLITTTNEITFNSFTSLVESFTYKNGLIFVTRVNRATTYIAKYHHQINTVQKAKHDSAYIYKPNFEDAKERR